MLASVMKSALIAALGIGVAAPGGTAPIAPPVIQDGEATAAACRPLGFELEPPIRPMPIARPAPPPPITLPIQPTRKQDRVEYGAPPPSASASSTGPAASARHGPRGGEYRGDRLAHSARRGRPRP